MNLPSHLVTRVQFEKFWFTTRSSRQKGREGGYIMYRCEGKNSFLTNPLPRFLLSPCSQAIAVTSVINDRRCIKSFDATSLPLSPMMLLSCCPNCCGCSGGNGHVLNAWKFTRDVGLVTGTMNSDNILQPDDVLLLCIYYIHSGAVMCLTLSLQVFFYIRVNVVKATGLIKTVKTYNLNYI